MTLEKLRTYKKILILGYGEEGKASEQFIKKFHPDAEIGIADQKLDPQYLDKQKEYDLAIRTPLLRPKLLEIPYTTGTNLFFGNVTNKIIGITGSKGKSTTVSLLHHILRWAGLPVRLYGNIGIPMLQALNEGIDKDDIFILELSNYQLEDCEYSPHIACMLNIYEELHNHDSFEEYFDAKSNITLHQSRDDLFFYNGEQPLLRDLAEKSPATAINFAEERIEDILGGVDVPYFTHPDNMKAMWAIAKHLDVPLDAFQKHLQSFTPLAHRLTKVGEYDGITFYDDSAAVHPNSTIFALSVLKDIDTLILGGQERGYNFSELIERLAAYPIRNLILFPDTGKTIAAEIEKLPTYRPHITQVTTMDEAVEEAFARTERGKTCLLSPGAPSYLTYANLHERARDFVSTIERHEKIAQKDEDSSDH